ncbi:MAG: DPP IV N-terminal domain-containing protein [Bacteroidales bacterium]
MNYKKLIFCVLLSVVLVFAGKLKSQTKEFTIEDAVYPYANQDFRVERLSNACWIPAHEKAKTPVLTYIKDNSIYEADVAKGNTEELLSLERLNQIFEKEQLPELKMISSFRWLSGHELLLRTKNNFVIINTDSDLVEAVLETSDKARNITLSPDGRGVAYTEGNSLYVSTPMKKAVLVAISESEDLVYGQTVSRNEFGISGGIFWSPQSSNIAFYEKDEFKVADYPLVDFMAEPIAKVKNIKYPMAGQSSELLRLGIFDVKSGSVKYLNIMDDPEQYITSVSWTPDEKYIFAGILNRAQTHLQMNKYDAQTGEFVQTLFEDKSDTYVEPQHPLVFDEHYPDKAFYMSRRDGWFHIYEYDLNTLGVRQLTTGEWEVTGELGFTDEGKYLVFQATKESPLERHIYKLRMKDGSIEKLPLSGTMNNVKVTNGFKNEYLFVESSSPDVPYEAYTLRLDGKKRSQYLKAADFLKDYKIGTNELFTIKAADGNTDLWCRLIKPFDFDENKKYPVIIYVYGGPHAQMITRGYRNSVRRWQYYMANQGYILFTVDSRGSANRGADFETAIHKHLGVEETKDQMKGVEYLKSLSYVDADRIGVHGWSYGGFMTLNMMLRQPETFKVGVAGGPVVDWRKYEVMYGERYMGQVSENADWYNKNNMTKFVEHLQGKLMLIHGAQDDVVLPQHSLQFLRECVKQNKPVDFFIYPTHPHNVRGKDRIHLMQKVTDYFLDNL